MKAIIPATAILLLTFVPALAENCPDDAHWNELKKNMMWTLTDGGARQCYLNTDGNAFKRLEECNTRIFGKGSTHPSRKALENCWPSFVCNFMNANGAPGC